MENSHIQINYWRAILFNPLKVSFKLYSSNFSRQITAVLNQLIMSSSSDTWTWKLYRKPWYWIGRFSRRSKPASFSSTHIVLIIILIASPRLFPGSRPMFSLGGVSGEPRRTQAVRLWVQFGWSEGECVHSSRPLQHLQQPHPDSQRSKSRSTRWVSSPVLFVNLN